MKIYPKQLRDVSALQREKARLLRTREDMEQGNFILSGALSAAGKKKGKKKAANHQPAGQYSELISMAAPAIEMVKDIITSRINKQSNPAAHAHKPAAKKEEDRSVLTRLAFEFIGGYLKWKAIELGYKAIRRHIRNRAEKKNSEQ